MEISVIAEEGVTPSPSCHWVCSFAARSRKSRNPLLPKRESPCSSGGLRRTASSTLSRIERMAVTAGLSSLFEIAETGVSTTESVRLKTKARRSLYVGDERKVSWSCGDRIRLVGFLKSRVERSGGEGRFGVSGTGRGLEGGACRRRGCSFGKRSFRFGIPAAALSFSMVGDSAVEGILALMLFDDGVYQGSLDKI